MPVDSNFDDSAAIVLVTRDRASILSKSLESLVHLRSPERCQVELWLVDNGSQDSTWEVIQDFAERHPKLRIHSLQVFEGGKSRALNAALRDIRCDYVAFTDDDMRFDEGWLEGFVSYFRRGSWAGLQGRVLVDFLDGRPNWLTEKATLLYGATPHWNAEEALPSLGGLNMAARMSAIRQAGEFREDLGPVGRRLGYSEDSEWSARVGQFGTLAYCPEALNHHQIPSARISKWQVLKRQFGFVRTEWALRIAQGRYPSPFRELLSELKCLAGALLFRRAPMLGIDYGLEISARLGRIQALMAALKHRR